MKKLLVSVLMVIALTASAKTDSGVDLQKKWGAVIEAIAMVESNRDPSKVSRNGLYVGYLQISQILVRECNRIVGYNKYTYADRYNKEKSIEMFITFQECYNSEGNMEKAIRLWNSGDLKCMSRKMRTEGYYRRVMSKYTETASL
ncbi:MAG: lytic transglycosylase domain-containing protein [Bacteroidaceae bacterium]|nr:lytic transglycosylase domain-containing protein [Bacteroidaceae bacterium]